MADNFNDYFEENTQWVTGNSAAPVVEPPKPPKSRREMRKRRKNRQRKRWLIAIVVLVILGLVCGGVYFGVRHVNAVRAQNEVNARLSEDYEGSGTGSVSFTVESGEDALTIGRKLVKAGVVKSAEAFANVVGANNVNLYPGTFELKKHMSNADAMKILSDTSNAKGFFDVKAGERVSDVIKGAAEMTGIAESDFQSIVDGDGSGILPSEANGKFEGWLEPGQYDIKSKTSAKEVLKMMVDRRIEKLDSLGVPTGAEREKILNMASIAEAEVNQKDDYGKVVRVILNRLAKDMTLGMDSTVAYGNNVESSQITQKMLDDSSNKFNTRIQKGLPPTPISNPGDSAIQAALDPPQGDWLYFVTTDLNSGTTEFTDNADEFDKLVQKYKANNKNAN